MKRQTMPPSWIDFADLQPQGVEIVPFVLFDTQFYISEVTEKLRFFQRNTVSDVLTNMYLPNTLPNPQSFLIEAIRIYGISSAITFGLCRLEIGNKRYLTQPAWTFGLKEKGYPLSPPLMIAPLQYFVFSIEWMRAEQLGAGLSGKPKAVAPIQVCLYGKLARR